MTPPEIRKYLFDIGEACDPIRGFVAGRSFEDYTRDRMLRGRESPLLKPVLVALAERRLGTADEARTRQRLEEALAAADNVITPGQTPTGATVYAQALTLKALGREAEAREHLQRVFLLPDVRLSHFLARRALEANDPL